MKRVSTISTLATLAIIALFSTVFATPAMTPDGGATQIAGTGAFAAPGECNDPQGDGSDYALTLTGDLSGCHYVFVEVSRCSPGRAYFEAGTETFVGIYNGESGTFGTNYVFTATYRECPVFGGQIAGRCQHPIAAGTGTDVFEGVIGRIDMKDDVATGTFSYRGHLSFEDASYSRSAQSFKDAPDLIGLSITGGGC
jgi:hypothetical protein